MKLSFPSEASRDTVFRIIEKHLSENDFHIIKKDTERPWGGFFVIDEKQSKAFIKKYFRGINKKYLLSEKKISPKILIIEPGKKLSWQYHNRRAEIWKVIGGEAGIVISETDEETEMKIFGADSVIKLKKGERHRLIGLDSWGIVAEIWQHTDDDHPSNEEDIIRLKDEYGR